MKDLLKYILILLLFLNIGLAKSESTGSTGNPGGYPSYSYQNGTLTIPRVDVPGQVGRYQDVVFQFDPQLNAWTLQDFNSRDKTAIPKIDLVSAPFVFESSGTVPITVRSTITGEITCGRLGQINQRRIGNLFEVQVTQEPLAPDEVCDQVPLPFIRVIQLDVERLEAGEYQLHVIGTEGIHTFTLPDTTLSDECGGSPEEVDPTISCRIL